MISYKTVTEKGGRTINEDSVGQYVDKNSALFIVADGLGGHGGGNTASQYVVENYLMKYDEACEDSPERYMSGVFADIHAGLHKLQKETGKDMKSTAAAVILRDKRLTVCHIGDSRVYLFSRRKLLYRTLDHSVPQMLVYAGDIKEKSIRHHPDRNRLTRALGEESETVNCDFYSTGLTDKLCAILLCSDGFWEYIDEREMLHLLRKSDTAGVWLDNMLKIVLKNGKNYSMDNYSAVAVFLG